MSNAKREAISRNELSFYKEELIKNPSIWRSHLTIKGTIFSSINRKQLEIKTISQQYSFFPYNLYLYGPSAHKDDDELMLEVNLEYSRFIGFLKGILENSFARRLLAASLSGNGMGSPYTIINPFQLARRYRSPGRFLRRMFAIRERANVILRPYKIHVSWRAMALVMCYGPFKTGKAAIMAAANTLAREDFRTYRAARTELERMSRKGAEEYDDDGEEITVFAEGNYNIPYKQYYSCTTNKKRERGIYFYASEYKETIYVSPSQYSCEDIKYGLQRYEEDMKERSLMSEMSEKSEDYLTDLGFSSEYIKGINFSPITCLKYVKHLKHIWQVACYMDNDIIGSNFSENRLISLDRLIKSSFLIDNSKEYYTHVLSKIISTSLIEAKEWASKLEQESKKVA